MLRTRTIHTGLAVRGSLLVALALTLGCNGAQKALNAPRAEGGMFASWFQRTDDIQLAEDEPVVTVEDATGTLAGQVAKPTPDETGANAPPRRRPLVLAPEQPAASVAAGTKKPAATEELASTEKPAGPAKPVTTVKPTASPVEAEAATATAVASTDEPSEPSEPSLPVAQKPVDEVEGAPFSIADESTQVALADSPAAAIARADSASEPAASPEVAQYPSTDSEPWEKLADKPTSSQETTTKTNDAPLPDAPAAVASKPQPRNVLDRGDVASFPATSAASLPDERTAMLARNARVAAGSAQQAPVPDALFAGISGAPSAMIPARQTVSTSKPKLEEAVATKPTRAARSLTPEQVERHTKNVTALLKQARRSYEELDEYESHLICRVLGESGQYLRTDLALRCRREPFALQVGDDPDPTRGSQWLYVPPTAGEGTLLIHDETEFGTLRTQVAIDDASILEIAGRGVDSWGLGAVINELQSALRSDETDRYEVRYEGLRRVDDSAPQMHKVSVTDLESGQTREFFFDRRRILPTVAQTLSADGKLVDSMHYDKLVFDLKHLEGRLVFDAESFDKASRK